MCAAIEKAATCEMWSVIRFLLAKNNTPIEIYRELCVVYGQGIMSENRATTTSSQWLLGTQRFDSDVELHAGVNQHRWQISIERVLKNLCHGMINALI